MKPSEDKELDKELKKIIDDCQKYMTFPNFVVSEICRILDEKGYHAEKDNSL